MSIVDLKAARAARIKEDRPDPAGPPFVENVQCLVCGCGCDKFQLIVGGIVVCAGCHFQIGPAQWFDPDAPSKA